jgi:hypothetical protein
MSSVSFSGRRVGNEKRVGREEGRLYGESSCGSGAKRPVASPSYICTNLLRPLISFLISKITLSTNFHLSEYMFHDKTGGGTAQRKCGIVSI